MSYYVARLNTETGLFELVTHDDNGPTCYSESEAIESCESLIQLEGQNNMMLLKSVSLDVNVNVRKHHEI